MLDNAFSAGKKHVSSWVKWDILITKCKSKQSCRKLINFSRLSQSLLQTSYESVQCNLFAHLYGERSYTPKNLRLYRFQPQCNEYLWSYAEICSLLHHFHRTTTKRYRVKLKVVQILLTSKHVSVIFFCTYASNDVYSSIRVLFLIANASWSPC